MKNLLLNLEGGILCTEDVNPTFKLAGAIVRNLLKPTRSALLAIFLFSTAINLLLLSSPLYMLQVFDRVISSKSVDTLIWLTLLVVGALVTLSFVDFLRHQMANRIGQWIGERYAEQIMRAGLAEASQSNSKNRVGQVIRDLGTVRQFISSPAFLALYDLPLAPLFIFVIFLLHPYLGLLAAISCVLVFVLAMLEEKLSSAGVATTNFQLGRVYGDAEKASRSAAAVVAMGFAGRYAKVWNANYARLLKGQGVLNGTSAKIGALTRLLRFVMQVAAMGLGALLVIQAEITPGAMIAGSILIARAVGPIEQGISAWRGFLSYRQAQKRLAKAAELFQALNRTVNRGAPKGGLSAENLSYVVPNGNEFLFKGVEFAIAPGQSLGIVGSTGAGKTTLARLLLGLQAPTAGCVRLDNTDLSTWDSDDLGQYLGYVPQSTQLLNGTVKENIARFSDAPLSEIVDAAELVGVHQHILRLPQGYDTAISDAEAQLSGGELQRVALARGIFGKPALVVMDEPNANLDPQGETSLIKAITHLKQRGTSVVIITHRANLLRSMDKVLMLQNATADLIQSSQSSSSSKDYAYLNDVVGQATKSNSARQANVRRIQDAK